MVAPFESADPRTQTRWDECRSVLHCRTTDGAANPQDVVCWMTSIGHRLPPGFVHKPVVRWRVLPLLSLPVKWRWAPRQSEPLRNRRRI